MFNNMQKHAGERSMDTTPSSGGTRNVVVRYLLLLALVTAAPVSSAQGEAPDALLRAVSVKVIDMIKQYQEIEPVDPAKVAALVETDIMPLFDFVHMTRLSMARNWRLATPEQQRALTAEFKTLLARTYSTALEHYRGEVIHFKQLRAVPRGTEVTVRSEVKQAGKEPMTMDYHMANTAAGWKIYDVKVAGVRLVSTYREVFAEKVRAVGVDGLILSLADGNRGGRSRFNAIKDSFWERSRIIYAIFQSAFRRGQ